jgi:diacylglycerol kinase (ATP)
VWREQKAVYHLKIDGQGHEVEDSAFFITNTGNLGFSKISFDKHIYVSDGLLDVISEFWFLKKW